MATTAEFSEAERHAVAAGLNVLLRELGHPEAQMGDVSDWWNLVPHRELDGRTATKAWLDGDIDKVRALIEGMYEASTRSAERLAADPVALERLRGLLAS